MAWSSSPLPLLVLAFVAVSLAQDLFEDCPKAEQQDIIIVLDSSTSIARPDFKKQLDFINSLIDKVDIGPDDNQFGVISFSDNYRLNFHLNANRRAFRGQVVGPDAAISKAEKTRLKTQVSSIKQIGGGTNTHKPLEYAKRYMFNARRGDRPDKRNVAIVITDGQSQLPDKTAAAAKALEDAGTLMFALGVGPQADRSELITIAGSEDRVFQAVSYDELNSVSTDFSRSVLGSCPARQRTTPTPADPLPPSPVLTGMPAEPVEVGRRITLRCVTETTDPDTELSWFRDGVEVPRTTQRSEGNTIVSVFTFTSQLSDDGDRFDCVLRHPRLPADLRVSDTVSVLIIPSPPQITYDPSSEVYDGTMVSIVCTTQTADPDNTDLVWLQGGSKVEGSIEKRGGKLSNTLLIPAVLGDTAERYECHVLHRNLPEPLVAYASLTVLDLPGPPVITASPEGPVRSGSRVSLTCISEGTDRNTKLYWYRDGGVVDSTYSIVGGVVQNEISVTATTEKEFECRVTHRRLEDDLAAIHTIQVYILPNPPTIKSPEQIIAPDSSVTLECSATNADGNTELLWVDNRGREIDRTYILTGSIISNEHTFSSYSEVQGHKCIVRHIYLPNDREAIPPVIRPPVVLPGPPEINDGRQIERVVSGTSVDLVCKSFGTSRDTQVVWYKVGRNTPVDRTHEAQGEYIVNRMTVEARAEDLYECRVMHPQLPEDLTSVATLTVINEPGPPRISGISQSQYEIGDSVTAVCRSEGTSPDTQLVWYVDGRPVDRSYAVSRGYVENEYRFAVTSTPIQPECRLVFPPTGKTESAYAVYTVEALPGPPVITGNTGRPVSLGSTLNLICTANGTSSDIRLTWERDGNLIDIDYRRLGNQIVNEYSIKGHTGADVNMTCRMEFSPAKLELTDSTLVKMQGDPAAPEITGVPADAVEPGKVVTLQCRSLGTSSKTKLIWYKNGREIGTRSYRVEGDYVVTSLTYTTRQGDIEPIECRLEFQPSNLRLSDYANIVLIGIPGTPEIVGTPIVPVSPGSVVQLVCRSYGTSKDTALVWYRDGKVIDRSYYITEDYVMNIYELAASDVGSYNLECRLNFPPMDLEYQIETVVRVQDSTPGDPVIIPKPDEPQLPGSNYTLFCRSEGDSAATRLVWYNGNQPVDDSYQIESGYIVNQYDVSLPAADAVRLECRLVYPPTGLAVSDFVTIPIAALPERPEIIGVPRNEVPPGTRLRLVCRSRGTHPDTMVIWLRDGRTVDTTYKISGGYVLNEYDFVASREDLAKLDCVVRFPPTGLQLVVINIDNDPPEEPSITQNPPEVQNGARVTLSCRVRHNGRRDMMLTWHREDNMVDDSYNVEGDYIVNTFDIIASTRNKQYECRLTDRETVINVPYTVKISQEPIPPPIISGTPSTALPEGSSFNLTCTWPQLLDTAYLIWLDPITKEEIPAIASFVQDNSFVSVLATQADPRSVIYECKVGGVTDTLNNTLLDRVRVRVTPLDEPEERDCAQGGGELDVVIVLDSSTSITRENFRKVLDFISSFVGSFEIGPNDVQVGILSFSNDVERNFYMNANNNMRDLQDAILAIEQMGGGTNTHLPIREAREDMFLQRNGDRAGASDVLIILTDGNSYSRSSVEDEARLAREAGIDIYSIGVGVDVDMAELSAISGQRDRVYYAEDYNSLLSMENEFAKATKVSFGPCPDEPSAPTVVGEWSRWSPCSVTCGPGEMSRRRSCTRGNDGRSCPQILTDRTRCNEQECPRRPEPATPAPTPTFVSEWTRWSRCSVTCGQGRRSRRRDCIPGDDGLSCPPRLEEQDRCYERECTVRPDPATTAAPTPTFVTEWTRWSRCSVTCGTGRRSRRRDCIPGDDGLSCPPRLTDEQRCYERECTRRPDPATTATPTPTFISEWTRWSRCSVTCGQGRRSRSRDCIQGNDGLSCPSWLDEQERCMEQECRSRPGPATTATPTLAPIPTFISQWTRWSRCSVTCGQGRRSRSRDCLPGDDGLGCPSRLAEQERCMERACTGPPDPATTATPTPAPTPTFISEWTRWSRCSVTCGQGRRSRSRDCLPGDDGLSCPSRLAEQERCMERACTGPPDPATTATPTPAPTPTFISKWTRWSRCSVTCGQGRRSRSRDCLPGDDGLSCPSRLAEQERCMERACTGPPDPTTTATPTPAPTPTFISEWTRWSQCSVTCGQGRRSRSRDCIQGDDGLSCPSRLAEQERCMEQECTTGPEPTVVSDWTEWSPCSVTCGPGVKSRRRDCTRGTDGTSCPDTLTEQQLCIDKICPRTEDCIPRAHQADIAFLLDTSSSVYEPDFDKMKLFLADLINLFNVSQSEQRIASATFSDEVRVNFHLDDYNSNDEVKAAFLRIPMHLGGTRTHDALNFARRELFSEVNGARTSSAKIVFVITDGKSYEPSLTEAEAELARREGIIIYSIGIGPAIDEVELNRIAGEVNQVYHVETYDDIATLKQNIGVDLNKCYNPLAAVNGGYGSWGPYSECSVTCGSGTRTRTRACDSPPPRNGGADCEGPSTRTSRCRLASCTGGPPTRPPGWTDWEFSSSCSVTCGEGTQEVSRVCQYADGCQLGQVESRTVTCQRDSCSPLPNRDQCGGPSGLNVMFASQGINSNGPNSYFAVDLIANVSALLSVDGDRVRTSLTLSDCSCGKNTGYDLTRYRNFEDVYNHLHDLDLGDTASLLRKVRESNRITPSVSDRFALSDRRSQILVYMFDTNDAISPDAISEAKKLKLAGVGVYAAVLSRDVDLSLVRQIVSQPENAHMQVVDTSSSQAYIDSLFRSLCGTQ